MLTLGDFSHSNSSSPKCKDDFLSVVWLFFLDGFLVAFFADAGRTLVDSCPRESALLSKKSVLIEMSAEFSEAKRGRDSAAGSSANAGKLPDPCTFASVIAAFGVAGCTC
jgi:hypothetical protein